MKKTKSSTLQSERLSSNQESVLLTKTEAAEFLGIAPRTLDEWRKAKAIACIERPGFVRFLRSDLDAFIECHRQGQRRKKQRHSSTERPKMKRMSVLVRLASLSSSVTPLIEEPIVSKKSENQMA